MSKRIAGPKPSDLSYMDEHYTVLHYTTHVLYLHLGPDMISNAFFAWQRIVMGLALTGGVWGWWWCGGWGEGGRAIEP